MKKILALTIVIFTSITIAQSAGIQVSPSKLDLKLSSNKPESLEIVAANPTADVQLFEIYADDFKQAVTASPKSFTLESGARRTVTITVDPQGLQNPGNQMINTELSIVSHPLTASNMRIGTGVKLPVNITVNNQTTKNLLPLLWLVGGAAVLILPGIAFLLIIRKKRTSKAALEEDRS